MKIQPSQTSIQLNYYGYTEDTAIYGDATFFCNSGQELDDVMKELNGISGINWKSYTLVKSSSNYPALEQSHLWYRTRWPTSFWGSLSFSVLLLPPCSAFGSMPVARKWVFSSLSVSRQVSWVNSSLNPS